VIKPDPPFRAFSRRRVLQGALAAAPVVAAPAALVGAALPGAENAYAWRNVRIGGGGYVTGIVIHPKEKNLIYIRTDVGGVYRWNDQPNDEGMQWLPLTDRFTVEQWNYYGVESIALDPGDPNVVYAALGKYPRGGKGRVFRSFDRGATWAPLGLEVSMHGNGPLKDSGERLVVHPRDSGTIFFGSRDDGLWRTSDGGGTWTRLLPADVGDEGLGITFVHIDAPAEGDAVIYAAVAGKGLLQSRDGGGKWTAIDGPKISMRAATGRDGALIVTSPTGVFRFENNGWSDITPDPAHEYSGVSVDPGNPDVVVAAASEGKFLLPLFVSSDGGRNWIEYTQQNGRAVPRPEAPWWPGRAFASAISAAVIDPHAAGRLWFTDWDGVWRTDDLFKNEQVWTSPVAGIENTVVMTLSTPPTGGPLLSGCADVDGFLHRDLDRFPETDFDGIPIWNTLGIDYHEADPIRLVRAGIGGKRRRAPKGGVGVSEDGGETWRPIDWPHGPVSKVAYSATDPNTIVALPLGGGPKATRDLGVSWHGADGLVKEAPIEKEFQWSHPLAADRVDGKAFYLLAAGEFLRTLDGGRTWKKTAKLPKSRAPMVEAAPGHEGIVWVSLERHGLYASPNKGETFVRLGGIDHARLFSFGMAAPGMDLPSVFLYGRLAGADSEAIYRSDDMGRSWTRISSPEQPIGDQPNIMRGDRQVFGRVYVGTNGRGVFVGEIAAARGSSIGAN
jgi:photosystem II stability/assembly factor-like uncharacterized protein